MLITVVHFQVPGKSVLGVWTVEKQLWTSLGILSFLQTLLVLAAAVAEAPPDKTHFPSCTGCSLLQGFWLIVCFALYVAWLTVNRIHSALLAVPGRNDWPTSMCKVCLQSLHAVTTILVRLLIILHLLF